MKLDSCFFKVRNLREPNGLYYMNARYYDPTIGRFLSEDPLGLGGGDLTLYSYAGNNPLVFVDPSGLCAESGGSTYTFSPTKIFPITEGNKPYSIHYEQHIGVLNLPLAGKATSTNFYTPEDATFPIPFNNRYLVQYDISNDGNYKARVIQSKRFLIDIFKHDIIPVHHYEK